MNDIRSHLICERIIPNCTKWIWHGELVDMAIDSHTYMVDEDIPNCIEDMIHDLGQEGFRQAHAPLYEQLQIDSKNPL